MNCIILSPNKQKREAIEEVVSQNKSLKILKSVPHIDQAKRTLLNHKKIDVVFIHIEKPGMDGWGMLDELKNGRPFKIFLSSKKELAQVAFDYDGSDFISLPITQFRLIKALEKITRSNKNVLTAPANQDFVFIKTSNLMIKLAIKDILYIKGLGDYVTINTGSKSHIVHSTMKNILSKLPENDFIRVHKSFIVRLDSIKQIEANAVKIDSISIPLSRVYRRALIGKINFLE